MPLISGFSGGGGGGSGPRLDKAYYNFPLSIGPEFPVPVVDGHIYVQMPEAQAAQITKVYIDSAVRVSHEDGSLILVCQNRDTYLSIQEVRKVDGREVIVSDLINADAQSNGWQAGYNAEAGNIRKTMPMVYAKLGGVVEMQTAWVYHGEKWVQLSVKGQYLMLAGNAGPTAVDKISVYNWDGDQTFAKNDAFPEPAFPVASAQISPDGRFIFYLSTQSPYLFGYRRTGETWEQLPTVNYNARAPHTWITQYQLRGIAFSPSGHHMAVSVSGGVDLYKRKADSSTYEFLAKITGFTCAMSLCYTADGSALYIGANDRNVYCYEIAGDAYTRVSGAFLPSTIAQSNNTFPAGMALSPDGVHMAIAYYCTSQEYAPGTSGGNLGGVVWTHLRNGRIPVQTAVLSEEHQGTSGSIKYNLVSVNDVQISPDGKYVFFFLRLTSVSYNTPEYGLRMAKVEDDNFVKRTSVAVLFSGGVSAYQYQVGISLSQDGSRLIARATTGGGLFSIDYETMKGTQLTGSTIPAPSICNHPQFVPYNTIML